MDRRKLAGITAWPVPKPSRQVRSFLGFGNFYRRFIAGYSRIVKPLTELTKKDHPFIWTETCQKVFEELKRVFLSEPILRIPNPDKPFFLEIDASAFASGAVLMQRDETGNLHSCGYLSKTFNATEQNYPIYDRELFALIRALQEWKVLLEGAHHEITVYSDHANLKYFRSARDLNPRQFRWSMYLSRFPIKLEHRPGKTMILSDALSRRADQEEQKVSTQHLILLPHDLFIKLVDVTIGDRINDITKDEFHPEIADRLSAFLNGEADKDWTIEIQDNTPTLFYRGKQHI